MNTASAEHELALLTPRKTDARSPFVRLAELIADITPGKPVIDLDSADLPDPVSRALGAVLEQVEKLEKRVAELSSRLEEPSAPERPELRKVSGDDT